MDSMDNLFDEDYEQEDLDQYLVFVLDEELYGIDIKHVIEVVGVENITSVPDYPDFAKGVIDFRDEIVPIIDLRILFRKGSSASRKIYCVITEFNDHKYGFVIDSVSEVVSFEEGEIAQPPKASESFANKFVFGVSKLKGKMVMLLEPDKIFDPSKVLK
ncbi:MAG: chemotaxis protein CheW [Clostridia bacterium]|nr:chemotaxis protein CheW [Clostridia bacterium]